MTDIAAMCGLSVGTLDIYFESKNAVLTTLFARHCARLQAKIEQPFDSKEPRDQLRQLLLRACEYVKENAVVLRSYFKVDNEDKSPGEPNSCFTSAANPEQFEAMIRSVLAQGIAFGRIRSDTPFDALTWGLHTLFRTLLNEWSHQQKDHSLTRKCDQIVSVYLDGAAYPCSQLWRAAPETYDNGQTTS